MSTLPTYFISHGGGPWPWVPEMRADNRALETSLAAMPGQWPEQPKAILMVSGHWEDDAFAVMSAAQPGMMYDYYGFPEHTYHIHYRSPGAPDLAARTHDLIKAAGLPTRLDAQRGYDHGMFAPMEAMIPQANIPVFQVAMHHSLDPAAHLALGQALAPLRNEGVLIIGSGLSYHNLRNYGPMAAQPAKAFDDWLQGVMILPPKERVEQLLQWAKAPFARVCHPREDHLIPLMVAVGAALEDKAICTYHEEGIRGGVVASSFKLGV
jgi:aromatic ring-opening dioxygenase catalytic subunit (LigB family)